MADESKLVVLLLDDDPIWLRALGKLLERRGASVIALTSAETLLERAADRTPDVMVIDFLLGEGKTGADVARTLREQLRQSCPALLLLSSSLPEVSDQDFAPFDAAYTKVTPPADLVHYILERANLSRGSRSRPSLRSASVGELGIEELGDDQESTCSGEA